MKHIKYQLIRAAGLGVVTMCLLLRHLLMDITPNLFGLRMQCVHSHLEVFYMGRDVRQIVPNKDLHQLNVRQHKGCEVLCKNLKQILGCSMTAFVINFV